MLSLPISSLFAALFAIMLIVLSALVGMGRTKAGVSLGDGDNVMLLGRIRAQGNFIEYVPIGLILLVLCEAGGASQTLLWIIGLLLLAGRIIHAAGMYSGTLWPRGVGMLGTFASMLTASIILLIGYFA